MSDEKVRICPVCKQPAGFWCPKSKTKRRKKGTR